ncbi:MULTISPECIES: hypothetical protein [unclassified Sphingobacterium]|uniref:hypothetical protein n=1 Tax=unclassified Sphingobacterium TaxID=2609468 RepID=UPI0025CCDF0A|nr:MULTISPECIES: hypothetical protein [unclassified Sphingobacterium]
MKELYASCLTYTNNLNARIGGKPPEIIENNIPDDYKFYAVIHHPEKPDKMLSILIHSNFDVLLENNIYPNIAIQVIEHEYSEMGDRTDKAISSLGIHSISKYSAVNESDFLFLKAGGEPRLIQPKSYYYEQLEKDNYSFLLQIEEEGYAEESDYVFMYGGLYLYKNNISEEVIAGFWQYS